MRPVAMLVCRRWPPPAWRRRLVPVMGTTALVTAALLVASVTPAAAHTRSQSFSRWYVDGTDVHASFTVQAREATRLAADRPAASLEELLAAHLAERVTVSVGDHGCGAVGRPRVLAARPGHLRVELAYACGSMPSADRPLAIRNDALFAEAPSHVHFATVAAGDGQAAEYLFTDSTRRHEVGAQRVRGGEPRGARPGRADFGAYLALGVEHIMVGVDHLAFLAALLLLCRRPREIVALVTGFTAGHSVTLSLAVLGVVEPDVAVIEALIGFTIALVAVENVAAVRGVSRLVATAAAVAMTGAVLLGLLLNSGPPPLIGGGLIVFTYCYLVLSDSREAAARWRPLLTMVFGLIHGFGFASVLLEIGLPAGRLLPSLLGFNLGVEIGQLVVVAALSLAAWALERARSREHPHEPVPGAGFDVASAALCGLGVFWFVARSF